MKPNNKEKSHNNLTINNLPPPIAEGKENDFTYSKHLSKLLRRFVRIAVPDTDQLVCSDIELLDDVMRFGNLSKVAKMMGCSQSYVSVRLRKILDQLEERVSQMESAKVNAQAQERITDLEQKLQDVHTAIRRQTVASARNKSMEVEAYLREHKHN